MSTWPTKYVGHVLSLRVDQHVESEIDICFDVFLFCFAYKAPPHPLFILLYLRVNLSFCCQSFDILLGRLIGRHRLHFCNDLVLGGTITIRYDTNAKLRPKVKTCEKMRLVLENANA